jgi:DsbC/DsbD-like thiol-disulfide interchange protein
MFYFFLLSLSSIFFMSCQTSLIEEKLAVTKSDHTLLELGSAKMSQDTLFVIMRFQMKPDWHIYWKNPGDAGLAPTFHWKIDGLNPGTLHWPNPKIFGDELVTSYGMEDTAYFIQELLWDSEKNSLNGFLEVEWLECKVECIPYGEKILLSFNKISSQNRPTENWLESASNQITKSKTLAIRALVGDSVKLDLTYFTDLHKAHFFPDHPDWFEASSPQILSNHSGRNILSVKTGRRAPKSGHIRGTLKIQSTELTEYHDVTIPVISASN